MFKLDHNRSYAAGDFAGKAGDNHIPNTQRYM